MANTRNGYPVRKTRTPLVRRPGPHSYGSEGGYRYFADNDVADILADAMWQWHTRIGLVRLWGGWRSPSYNDEVNGNVSSNHMSATATDTNWDKHPYERNFPKGGYHHGFTAAQLRELREILALYRDDTGRSIVRSGMDYAPGWVDAMHLETGMYTTNSRGGWSLPPRSKVRQVANKVRARYRPPRTFGEIEGYQRIVGVTPDGRHGPGTIAAIKRYQKARGVPQTGLWDEATKKANAPTPPKDDELMSDAQYNELKKMISDLSNRVPKDTWAHEVDRAGSEKGQIRVDTLLRYMASGADVDEGVKELREEIRKGGVDLEKLADLVVRKIFERGSQGFSFDYWSRGGQVSADHKAFPADRYSDTDMLLRIAEAVGVKEFGVYTAEEGPVSLEKRGESFVRKARTIPKEK